MSENGNRLVTRETVFRVADRLVSENVTPTNRLVREAIGGGSLGDVCPHLKEWRELRKAATRATLPDAVVSVIAKSMDESVHARVAQFQQEHATAIQDAIDWQLEANAANELATKSHEERDAALSALLVAQGHILRLEKENTSLHELLEQSRRREHEAEQRARVAERALVDLVASQAKGTAANDGDKLVVLLDA